MGSQIYIDPDSRSWQFEVISITLFCFHTEFEYNTTLACFIMIIFDEWTRLDQVVHIHCQSSRLNDLCVIGEVNTRKNKSTISWLIDFSVVSSSVDWSVVSHVVVKDYLPFQALNMSCSRETLSSWATNVLYRYSCRYCSRSWRKNELFLPRVVFSES